MLIIYQALLFVIVLLFGLLAISATDEKLQNTSAKLTGLGLVALLVTFLIL